MATKPKPAGSGKPETCENCTRLDADNQGLRDKLDEERKSHVEQLAAAKTESAPHFQSVKGMLTHAETGQCKTCGPQLDELKEEMGKAVIANISDELKDQWARDRGFDRIDRLVVKL